MPFRYFKGYNNAFVNNTCITVGPGYGAGPYSSDCYLDRSWTVSHNRVSTEDGNATVCGKSWAEWFASNSTRDVGSVISSWPTDRNLIQLAEALLNFSVVAALAPPRREGSTRIVPKQT
jgi:hypothetical protein